MANLRPTTLILALAPTPLQSKLAKLLKMHLATVQEAVDELERAGAICAREMLKTARVGLERESRLMRRNDRRASALRRDAGGRAGRGGLLAALRVQRARKGR